METESTNRYARQTLVEASARGKVVATCGELMVRFVVDIKDLACLERQERPGSALTSVVQAEGDSMERDALPAKSSWSSISSGILFGGLALAVTWHLHATSGLFEGFLLGILCGHVCSMIVEHARLQNRRSNALLVAIIPLSPFGALLLVAFQQERTLAAGYFLGSGSAMCFAWAMTALVRGRS